MASPYKPSAFHIFFLKLAAFFYQSGIQSKRNRLFFVQIPLPVIKFFGFVLRPLPSNNCWPTRRSNLSRHRGTLVLFLFQN